MVYHGDWIVVSGIAMSSAVGARKSASITVTCGSFDTGLPPPNDGHSSGYSQFLALGSRSPTGYVDQISATRTVAECVLHLQSGGDSFIFGIEGTSVPNNNNTFREIVVNGTVLNRAAADGYDSDELGNTWWSWVSGLPAIPDSGDITLTVRF